MKVLVIPQPTNILIEYEGKTIFCDTEKALITLIMNTFRIAEAISIDLKSQNFDNNQVDIDLYDNFAKAYRNKVFEKMTFNEPLEL